MEHFIFFAIALTVIAFLSIILARPIPAIISDEDSTDEVNSPLGIGQLNYIPTTLKSNLIETKAMHFSLNDANASGISNQDSDLRLVASQLTNLNDLVNEKNWI